MTPTLPEPPVCYALVPFREWLRNADPYVVASLLPFERVTSVDGVLHLRLMGSPAMARQLMGCDPPSETELQSLARSAMRLGRELRRQKRSRRNPQPPIAA